MRSHIWLLYLSLFILVGTGIGCGSSAGNGTAADANPGSRQTETATAIDAATTPTEVVAKFYDALRAGDEAKISALLTDKARDETAKSGLDIRSPGSSSLKYQIGEFEYVTAAKDGAHVKSIWTETDEQGQAMETEVIWVLRKQPSGWRIAGMATQIAEGQLPLLFNFEDPQDMLKKKEYVEKQSQEGQDDSTSSEPASVAEKTTAPTDENNAPVKVR